VLTARQRGTASCSFHLAYVRKANSGELTKILAAKSYDRRREGIAEKRGSGGQEEYKSLRPKERGGGRWRADPVFVQEGAEGTVGEQAEGKNFEFANRKSKERAGRKREWVGGNKKLVGGTLIKRAEASSKIQNELGE